MTTNNIMSQLLREIYSSWSLLLRCYNYYYHALVSVIKQYKARVKMFDVFISSHILYLSHFIFCKSQEEVIDSIMLKWLLWRNNDATQPLYRLFTQGRVTPGTVARLSVHSYECDVKEHLSFSIQCVIFIQSRDNPDCYEKKVQRDVKVPCADT